MELKTAFCRAVPHLAQCADDARSRQGIHRQGGRGLGWQDLTLLHDGHEQDIRLSGIDCPEKNQAYGKDAKKFTTSRVSNKVVTVQAKDVDRDGRTTHGPPKWPAQHSQS